MVFTDLTFLQDTIKVIGIIAFMVCAYITHFAWCNAQKKVDPFNVVVRHLGQIRENTFYLKEGVGGCLFMLTIIGWYMPLLNVLAFIFESTQASISWVPQDEQNLMNVLYK